MRICKVCGACFQREAPSKQTTCSKRCRAHLKGAYNRLPEAECRAADCAYFGKTILGLCPKHYGRFHKRGTTEIVSRDPSATKMTESDKRWVAGLIDCDGWIGSIKTRGTFTASVGFGNTNFAIVQEIQKVSGVGRIHLSKRTPPAKDLHAFSIGKSDDVADFLNDIFPYLVIKQEQASLILSMPPKNSRRADERKTIWEKCRILNRKGC